MSFAEDLRKFEQRLQRNMEAVKCPTHLCIGQEEVPEQLYYHIKARDWLFSTHRAHGHYAAKGGNMDRLWDEIMGLETGLNHGFSGSQGFSDASVNFHCSAIVGGLVGVAAGVALALKLERKDAIAVCCIGDAGTEQGVFWETLNFSALHSLPIAFICENNGMSVDSPLHDRQATHIDRKVESFGVEVRGSVESALRGARLGVPCFYEWRGNLECDHLNMSTMLPKFDLA